MSTTVLYDDFVGSAVDLDGTTPSIGGVWARNSLYSGIWNRNGSGLLLRPTFPTTGSTGETVYYSTTTAPVGDMSYEARIKFINPADSSAFGFMCESDTAHSGNGQFIAGWGSSYLPGRANGNLELDDPVAASGTGMTFNPTANTFYVLRLEIISLVATLKIDGVTKLTKTFSVAPTGKLGMYSYEDGAQNVLVDYFQVDSLLTPPFWTEFVQTREIDA